MISLIKLPLDSVGHSGDNVREKETQEAQRLALKQRSIPLLLLHYLSLPASASSLSPFSLSQG